MSVIHWIKEASNRFTTRLCNMALCMDPCNIEFVPDHFKTVAHNLNTQEMCNKATCHNPGAFYCPPVF